MLNSYKSTKLAGILTSEGLTSFNVENFLLQRGRDSLTFNFISNFIRTQWVLYINVNSKAYV